MARQGFSSEPILAAYFPGAEVSLLPSPGEDPVASSEHFELVYPQSQQAWVSQTLQSLESFRKTLGSRAAALPGRVRVETWDTTEEFIRAAGEPGWAAAGNDGRSIALQPLSQLARKGILDQTLRHELMHIVVHHLGAPDVPRWYLEGLVLYSTRERISGVKGGRDPKRRPVPYGTGRSPAADGAGNGLEDAVRQPRSESEMRAAYAEALERVQALARRRGETALWQILQKPSPEDLVWLKAAR